MKTFLTTLCSALGFVTKMSYCVVGIVAGWIFFGLWNPMLWMYVAWVLLQVFLKYYYEVDNETKD